MRQLLALSLLLLTACASATPEPEQPKEPPAKDVLIVHARLHGHAGDAVLVHPDGRWQVGPEAKLRAVTENHPTELDAEGGLVLPGFQDAHAHVLGGGLAAGQVDLEGARTPEECAARVKAWADAHPGDSWVEGRGWSYDIVPTGQFPTRQALDAVLPDRPVLLEAYDGHSMWANSKALALAGVGPDTKDPKDGRVVREKDGETPQGALLEEAGALVQAPPADHATQLRAVTEALLEYRRLGVTRVHAICSGRSEVALYEELGAQGRLPIDVGVALPLTTPIDEVLLVKGGLHHTRLVFLKGFLDGVIESRTAFLLAPYSGPNPEKTRGAPNYEESQLFALVDRAHAAGVPVALHCVGDAAVRLALDAFEAAVKAHPEVRLHHRIEHIETIDPADVPRFGRLGVIASMQPYHAVPSDAPSPDDAWSANLGEERLRRAFAWRDLLDAKATLAFGSDWPVMTQDPLRGLAVALTRQNERGLPAGGWQAHQRITADEALAAYAEGVEGSPGAEAALPSGIVVLTPDVRLDTPSTLWTGRVRYVIRGGRVHATDPR